MLRSMFSAISGLRAHQTMMDVVGNNLANVNTSGFKNSRATFQESLTQVERGASSPVPGAPADATAGGTNALQIGLGTRIAGVDTNFSQGSVQVTGRRSDLSINGDGFFVVRRDGIDQFMRGGAFNWDADGNLTTSDGGVVLGLPPGAGPPADAAALDNIRVDPTTHSEPTVAANGTVSARRLDNGVVEELFVLQTARFVNPGGLTRVGNGLFDASPNSGAAQIGEPNTEVRGFLQAGTLEMSNVDLAAEFTNMIIAQRGLQANSRTITSSDEILQELVNLKR